MQRNALTIIENTNSNCLTFPIVVVLRACVHWVKCGSLVNIWGRCKEYNNIDKQAQYGSVGSSGDELRQ